MESALSTFAHAPLVSDTDCLRFFVVVLSSLIFCVATVRLCGMKRFPLKVDSELMVCIHRDMAHTFGCK